MDIKQTPQGQVVQENSETLATDENPTFEETGPKVAMGIVEGKKGEVRAIDLPQTDHTHEKAGPAPLY